MAEALEQLVDYLVAEPPKPAPLARDSGDDAESVAWDCESWEDCIGRACDAITAWPGALDYPQPMCCRRQGDAEGVIHWGPSGAGTRDCRDPDAPLDTAAPAPTPACDTDNCDACLGAPCSAFSTWPRACNAPESLCCNRTTRRLQPGVQMMSYPLCRGAPAEPPTSGPAPDSANATNQSSATNQSAARAIPGARALGEAVFTLLVPALEPLLQEQMDAFVEAHAGPAVGGAVPSLRDIVSGIVEVREGGDGVRAAGAEALFGIVKELVVPLLKRKITELTGVVGLSPEALAAALVQFLVDLVKKQFGGGGGGEGAKGLKDELVNSIKVPVPGRAVGRRGGSLGGGGGGGSTWEPASSCCFCSQTERRLWYH